MPTGLIASLGSSATVTYAPQSNAKVTICWSVAATGSITINSVQIVQGSSASGNGTSEIFVSGWQTVIIATGASSTCIVSSIEENS